MKKLQRRAYSALLVALCLLFGTGGDTGRPHCGKRRL